MTSGKADTGKSVGSDGQSEFGAQVSRDDRSYVFHSWSAQGGPPLLAVAGAKGCEFWDYSGRRYLDFSSQAVYSNLGHQHPRVVQAIQEQADTLCAVQPSFANDRRSELARMLADLAPGDLEMSFFTNAGAEANENAIRMARQYTGRHKILAAYRSYHGATHGAIALTGDPRRWASEPAISGVVHFCGPYLYRSSFAARTEAEECERTLAHLEEIVMYEGPATVAAIILEPVVGTNGILVPPSGYLAGVRQICNRYGIVMILDEVMTGFGRTGAWFACQHFEAVPDLLTCAKGLTSGYVPLGAVLVSRRIADAFLERPYIGGLTYSGHPLACAAGVASINTLRDEGVVENAKLMGEDVFAPGLEALMKKHRSVGDVRGLGCFWGIEIVRDRKTREMMAPFNASASQMGPMGELSRAGLAAGLSLLVHWNVIVVAPPLIVTRAEAEQGLEILDDILRITDAAAA